MGSRFSEIVANSTVDRMYHSSATLLPGALLGFSLRGNRSGLTLSLLADGSVFSSGSNPNADYVPAGTRGYLYPSEYRFVALPFLIHLAPSSQLTPSPPSP